MRTRWLKLGEGAPGDVPILRTCLRCDLPLASHSVRVAYDPEPHEYREEGLRSSHERSLISDI